MKSRYMDETQKLERALRNVMVTHRECHWTIGHEDNPEVVSGALREHLSEVSKAMNLGASEELILLMTLAPDEEATEDDKMALREEVKEFRVKRAKRDMKATRREIAGAAV